MYVCINSVDIYLLRMIKFMLRWCICSMWRMLLPSGTLIGLLLTYGFSIGRASSMTVDMSLC